MHQPPFIIRLIHRARTGEIHALPRGEVLPIGQGHFDDELTVEFHLLAGLGINEGIVMINLTVPIINSDYRAILIGKDICLRDFVTGAAREQKNRKQ